MNTLTPIIIPSLGESISEVVLGHWLVTDGQWIERDAPLVEIESDKVTQELPAPVSGEITITKQTGEECMIGDTIGSIDETAVKPDEMQPESTAQREATVDVTSETIASAEQTKRVTPLAKKVADDLGVSLENVDGSGPKGRITKSDVINAKQTDRKSVV